MQVTKSVSAGNETLSGVLTALVIAVAAALFVVVLGVVGVLPVGGGGETAVSPTIPVTTADFRFTESELRVKAGETVTLELVNEDFMPHSFDVDAFDVHQEMPGNGRVTATFTPTEPGTYTFYCGVPGHEEAGMVGTLIVEP